VTGDIITRVGYGPVAVLAGLLAAVWLPPAALAGTASQPVVASEYRVKGAFIYNFMKFVEWPPAAPSGPFVVGLFGATPVGPFEAVFEGRTVHGRRVVVRAFDDVAGLEGCHVLFIAAGGTVQTRSALRAVAAQPVLTITDTGDTGGSGAMISLVPVETRLGFEVDLDLANAAGLQISSQLLSLARKVTSAPPGRRTP